MAHRRFLAVTGLSIVALAWTVAVPADTDPFPAAHGLRGHVEFWKRAFTVWGRDQLALHDAEYPALVYEIYDLPGPTGEAYTPVQTHFIRIVRERLEEQLRRLEIKVNRVEPLTNEDKDLALRITTQAGTNAIAGASRRVRVQRGLRERFRKGIEISSRYDREFRRIFRDAGLPEDLAFLPHVESSFDSTARSSAGAIGIWQFTRGAGHLFLTIDSAIDERLDPVAATYGAARYLQKAHEQLGDWALAVTAYNHGIEGMMRAHKRFGTDFERVVREYDGRRFGFASRNFYAEFLAAREIALDPEAYFPGELNPQSPISLDQLRLLEPATPFRIARRYGVELGKLAELNPAWSTRAVERGLSIPTGTLVWLPAGTLSRGAARGTDSDSARLYVE